MEEFVKIKRKLKKCIIKLEDAIDDYDDAEDLALRVVEVFNDMTDIYDMFDNADSRTELQKALDEAKEKLKEVK